MTWTIKSAAKKVVLDSLVEMEKRPRHLLE